MAFEILERNAGETSLLLAGIKDNGYLIAKKLELMLAEIFKGEVEVISISLDKRKPGEIKIDSGNNFDDRVLIIVDDVANSGRTMMYALKPFLEFHPKKIQTLVLVERTHKAFPINADYVGLSIATTLHDNIMVELENGEITGAWLE